MREKKIRHYKTLGFVATATTILALSACGNESDSLQGVWVNPVSADLHATMEIREETLMTDEGDIVGFELVDDGRTIEITSGSQVAWLDLELEENRLVMGDVEFFRYGSPELDEKIENLRVEEVRITALTSEIEDRFDRIINSKPEKFSRELLELLQGEWVEETDLTTSRTFLIEDDTAILFFSDPIAENRNPMDFGIDESEFSRRLIQTLPFRLEDLERELRLGNDSEIMGHLAYLENLTDVNDFFSSDLFSNSFHLIQIGINTSDLIVEDGGDFVITNRLIGVGNFRR